MVEKKTKAPKAKSDVAKTILGPFRTTLIQLLKTKTDPTTVDRVQKHLKLSKDAAKQLVYSGRGSLENLLAAFCLIHELESTKLAESFAQTVFYDPEMKSDAHWRSLPLDERQRLQLIQIIKLSIAMIKEEDSPNSP